MLYHRAFTLIEMLIVIVIIAVLASLAIPAIGMIKRMMKDTQCSHNLQQIGVALEGYKQQHNGQFPFNLFSRTFNGNPVTSLTSPGESLAGLDKLFVCPRDESQGADEWMGRQQTRGNNSWSDLRQLHESGCSYLNEVNGQVIGAGSFYDYFTESLPPAQKDSDKLLPSKLTWCSAKKIQLQTGNFPPWNNSLGNNNPMTKGHPFQPEQFPIIRCFHHYNWDNVSLTSSQTLKKVKAVAWGLNVFECSPWWECDIDKRFAGPLQ